MRNLVYKNNLFTMVQELVRFVDIIISVIRRIFIREKSIQVLVVVTEIFMEMSV